METISRTYAQITNEGLYKNPLALAWKIYSHFAKDSLYRNSIYLMLSTAVMSFFGFFFWILNARLFTAEDVGVGTTLISVSSLISSFSLAGLNTGIIKYLPKSNKKSLRINTSISFVALVALLISIVFLIALPLLSPKLMFLRSNIFYGLLFSIFSVFAALFLLIESIFVAYKRAAYVLIKNVIVSLVKLVLPLFFVSLGAYGIYSASAVAMVAACLVSGLFLIKNFSYKYQPVLNFGIIKDMSKFSGGIYIANLLGLLPALVLPLIITNMLSVQKSAYFYIDMMIANFLYIIPMAATQSLFAEGSHSMKSLRNHLKKAALIITLLLVPAIIAILTIGKYVLMAFGDSYSSEGMQLLQLFTGAAVFISINFIGNSLLYLNNNIRLLIGINALLTALVLGLSLLLINQGLFGIGLAWLIGQGVVLIIYFSQIKKYI